MNCEKDLLKYLKPIKLNYKFDDYVQNGKLQTIKSQINDRDINIKLLNPNLISNTFSLSNFIDSVYSQEELDISVSCCIASSIIIRRNYTNYQRYRLTKWIFGNKIENVIPSIMYINWNANTQLKQKYMKLNINYDGISPSIYSHLNSLENYKIVGVDKYDDAIDKIQNEPDLKTFYHASKSKNFKWYKVYQDENILKLLISNGYPIICSIVVYKDMMNLLTYQFGIVNTPDFDMDTPIGNHPIVLIGYDTTKRTFEFLNTWSEKWGDNGRGKISFDYILNNCVCGDFATLDYEL